MVLKSKKGDLEAEKSLFEQKRKHARRREMRKQRESESSDTDTGPASSRSTTPARSVTRLSSDHRSVASSLSPSNAQDSEQVKSVQLSPKPLSPTSQGTRINPIECELYSDESTPLTPAPSQSNLPEYRSSCDSITSPSF